jgi:hypothetical protein
MGVQVRDPARREVDPVAAQELRSFGPLRQLPHERATFDAPGAYVRSIAVDVVHHMVAGPGLDTVGMIRQSQDQFPLQRRQSRRLRSLLSSVKPTLN